MNALAAVVRGRLENPNVLTGKVVQRHDQAARLRRESFDLATLNCFCNLSVLIIVFPALFRD